MSYPFNCLGSPVVAHVLCPFLADRDLVCFFDTNKSGARELLDVIREKVEKLVFSRIPIFGKDFYQKYWGLEITDKFESQNIATLTRRNFLENYFGPNPLGEGRIKDHCFIPTVMQKTVMVEGRIFDFNLNLLSDITRNPVIRNYGKECLKLPNEYLRQSGKDSPQEDHLAITFVCNSEMGNDKIEEINKRLEDATKKTGYRYKTRSNTPSLTPSVVTPAFAEVAVRELKGENRKCSGIFTITIPA